MKKIVEYKGEHKAGWVGYVNNSPCATIVYQIAWKEVMHDSLGHRPRYVLATEGSRSKGFHFMKLRMVKADNLDMVHSQDKA